MGYLALSNQSQVAHHNILTSIANNVRGYFFDHWGWRVIVVSLLLSRSHTKVKEFVNQGITLRLTFLKFFG